MDDVVGYFSHYWIIIWDKLILLYVTVAVVVQAAEDCVLFYYLSKKSANYKQRLRRQHAPTARRKPKPFRPAVVTFHILSYLSRSCWMMQNIETLFHMAVMSSV